MVHTRMGFRIFLFPILIALFLIMSMMPIGRLGMIGRDEEVFTLQGKVYYVAPGGDDSNPGTALKPWQTIQKAADTMAAGDTVYIRAGMYSERVVPQNSGSAGNYITYAAYPGEIVTIDGSSVILPDALAGLFEVLERSYIRISGLRVIDAGPYDNNAAILVTNSSYIIVEKNRTDNTISSGIGVWASDHITVDGNVIERACIRIWQECLTVAETSWFEVKNNVVSNCTEEGIIVKDNASNGKVYQNEVHHVQATGLYVDSWNRYTHDIEVFQNLIHDVEAEALGVGSEDGGTLENVYIYNNIIYNNRDNGISVTRNGDVPHRLMNNIQIINNTVYNNGWSGGVGGILIDNPEAQNVVIRNNIVSQNLYFQVAVAIDVPAQNYTIDYNLIDGYRDHVGEGETRGNNYVEGAPLFVNASIANFHLREDSPAIDAGSAVGAPNTDFDNRPRPLDGDHNGAASYDIGAYEMPVYSQLIYLPIIRR